MISSTWWLMSAKNGSWCKMKWKSVHWLYDFALCGGLFFSFFELAVTWYVLCLRTLVQFPQHYGWIQIIPFLKTLCLKRRPTTPTTVLYTLGEAAVSVHPNSRFQPSVNLSDPDVAVRCVSMIWECLSEMEMQQGMGVQTFHLDRQRRVLHC